MNMGCRKQRPQLKYYSSRSTLLELGNCFEMTRSKPAQPRAPGLVGTGILLTLDNIRESLGLRHLMSSPGMREEHARALTVLAYFTPLVQVEDGAISPKTPTANSRRSCCTINLVPGM